MAAPPRFKGLFAEDFKSAPDWFQRFIPIFNELASGTVNALTGRLTRAENIFSVVEPFDFTTQAVAANTFPLRFKNKLSSGKPNVVFVASMAKFTGTAPSAAWSVTSVVNQQNEIELTFQGLENSTRYVGRLVYEG